MVSRHKVEIDSIGRITYNEKRLENNINNIKNGILSNIPTLSETSLNLLYLYLFNEEQSGQYRELFKGNLRYYLKLSLEASLANFEVALRPGKEMEIVLAGERIRVTGKETRYGINTAHWSEAFHISHILRDERAIERLLEIPEKLMRKSDIKGDEFNFLFVDFLKSLYLEPKKAPEKLMKAYKATSPEFLKIQKAIYPLYFTVPVMDMYSSFISGDKSAYTKNLLNALECNKFMYEKEKIVSIGSLYNLRITGVAALAYENGFPIEVESDYMPRNLVEGKL